MKTNVHNTSTTPSTSTRSPEELLDLAQTVLEGQGAWFDALSPEDKSRGQAVIDRARALIVEASTSDNHLVWDWLWDAAIDLGYNTHTSTPTTPATPVTPSIAEDKPQPEGVTRVEALEALARAVLEGLTATLTPHEASLGRAIIEDAHRLHEESGDVWSDPEDFVWEAARAWVRREAQERLLELWELPEKELWELPERRHHLRRLLMSFQEEAGGSPEEAIRLLREYIG